MKNKKCGWIRKTVTLAVYALALFNLQLVVLQGAMALNSSSSGAGQITASTTSLAFGNQVTGTSSASRSITVTNTGTAAVIFSSIAVTGGQADDFPQSNNCGTSLAAGAACTISVFFAPVSASAKSSTLTVTDSAGNSPQRVSLSGTGTSAAGIRVSATSLTFGSLTAGSRSAAQSISLTNSGTTAVSFSSIAVTGGQADDFAQSNNCGTALAAGSACNVSIFFTPVSAGAKSATLTITDSASGSPQKVSLSGTGIVPAPSALSYPSPQIFTVGTAISRLNPTVTGTVTNYYSQPALPAGLLLDTVSGQISGTPTASAPAMNYQITAANGTGSTSFSIVITVRVAAPSALSYHNPPTYYVGTPINPLWPSVTGTVTGYGISPSLPAGLTLNQTSGVISGTPTAAQADTHYTVTASNGTGSTSYVLSLTVILLAPQSLSYPSPQSLAVDLPIAPLSPFVVGVVTSYSVSPALPAGLSLDAKVGVITGTPTTLTPSATYTIKAANMSGSATFALAIAVVNVGVTPSHMTRLVAAGTPLIIQLTVQSKSLSGTLYVSASDPSNLFNSAATVTTTTSGYAVALEVSTTIAAGHYTGNALLTLCRNAACTNPQTPGSISVPFDVQVLSATSAWTGNNTPPLAAWSGVADWTMFQGNAAHTGYVPVNIDPNSFTTRWHGGPTLSNTPNDYNGAFANTLTTDGGRLYIATGTTLYALNELDASQIWAYDVSALQFPSVNPPAEANGTVYMAAGQQSSTYLFAFEETSGAVVFQSPMSSQWEHYFAPTIGADGVYTNAGEYGGVYGFDFTGQQLFFDSLLQVSQWTPAVDADHIYSYTGQMTVADPVTGAVQTTLNDPTFSDFAFMDGSAVLGAPGSVFAANYSAAYVNGGGWGNTLLHFNVNTQAITWQINGNYGYNPAYNAGVLYAANNSPLRLEARRESDGSLLWSWTPPQAGDNTFDSEVLLTKSMIFVSTNLATYGIDTTTHQLVFSYPFSGRLALSRNGILYIQGTGPIVAINVK